MYKDQHKIENKKITSYSDIEKIESDQLLWAIESSDWRQGVMVKQPVLSNIHNNHSSKKIWSLQREISDPITLDLYTYALYRSFYIA
jgi:hypothetical protein